MAGRTFRRMELILQGAGPLSNRDGLNSLAANRSGDRVKAGLQFERFIEFVDLPAERVVGREDVTVDRHRAIWLPANTRRRTDLE